MFLDNNHYKQFLFLSVSHCKPIALKLTIYDELNWAHCWVKPFTKAKSNVFLCKTIKLHVMSLWKSKEMLI